MRASDPSDNAASGDEPKQTASEKAAPEAAAPDGIAPASAMSGGLSLTRGAIGGVLMGLANLVPGISGGTMLVAAGVYKKFIDAVADITAMRITRRAICDLLFVIGPAAIAVLALAGPVVSLVVDYRWVMYSLFIGLTLGGVPVVWAMVRQMTPGVAIGAVVGLAVMIALAFAQAQNAPEPAGLAEAGGGGAHVTGSTGGEKPVNANAGTAATAKGGRADMAGCKPDGGMLLMFIAGVAAASAMILPGVSGGYLLLVLGVYMAILGAVDQFGEALKALDFKAMTGPFVGVVLPVGVGVVVGVAVVSNVLKWLLARHEKPTLGVLLGLLVGAVAGLWPFQQGVAPAEGSTFKCDTVVLVDDKPAMKTTGKLIKPEDYPTAFFKPGGGQIGGAVALVIAGFAMTAGIARFGAKGEGDDADHDAGDTPGTDGNDSADTADQPMAGA